jgi:two-component system cell cycle response regulator
VAGPILVVDDDNFFRQLASDMLSRKGYLVVPAASASQALDAVAHETFDLVITDLVMPEVDGFGLTAKLRERDPDQEVILVTQRTDVKGSAMALSAGVAVVLTKPVDEPDLLLSVQRAMERVQLRRERSQLQTENLEFARYQNLHQRCLEFLSQPDLEWLQERVAAELASVCDAQSAALWIADDRGHLVLRAYRGLLPGRAARQPAARGHAVDRPRRALAGPLCPLRQWRGDSRPGAALGPRRR